MLFQCTVLGTVLNGRSCWLCVLTAAGVPADGGDILLCCDGLRRAERHINCHVLRALFCNCPVFIWDDPGICKTVVRQDRCCDEHKAAAAAAAARSLLTAQYRPPHTRRRPILWNVWSTFWVGNFFPGSLSDGYGIGDHLAEGYAAAILKIYEFENKLKRPRSRENFTARLKRLKLTEILCSDEFFSSYLQSFSLASLSFCVALFHSPLFNILLPSHEPTTTRVVQHTCLFYLIETFRCTT